MLPFVYVAFHRFVLPYSPFEFSFAEGTCGEEIDSSFESALC